jgi:hypothetical protein
MSSIVLQFVVGEIVCRSVCTQDFMLDALDFPAEIGNWIVVVINLRLPPIMRERISSMSKQHGQGGSVAVAQHF